jgi:hypothetical protein
MYRRFLPSRTRKRSGRASARQWFTTRPQLETLETRDAPAVFAVLTETDNGTNTSPTPGSFRAALLQANAAANLNGPDLIVFDIPLLNSHTIHPPTALPTITEAVIISGTSQQGTGGAPIEITGDLAPQGSNGLTITSGDSTVQGLTINGFSTGAGIVIAGGSAANNLVLGNQLGTDVNGAVARPNGIGVVLSAGANANQIGGVGIGVANIISGNTGDGVQLEGAGTSVNSVSGNFIGTAADGAAPLGNGGAGVSISGGASGNTIGGTAAGSGNTIANDARGVAITANTSTGNRILGNSIYGNTGLGIDLGNDGTTPNGANPRSFPNNGQNGPVVLTAYGTAVSGVFTSQAGASYHLEFFATTGTTGQGKLFLGAVDVTSDASANGSFLATVNTVPAGATVTATATNNTTGDTSEFSITAPVTQRFVGSAYVDMFGRAVDVPGLAYWTNFLNAGASRSQFVAILQGSGEFWGHQADLIYQTVLHRAADSAGKAFVLQLLKNGLTIEQVKSTLFGSQEYFANLGGSTNDGFLGALYQDVLHRSIDSGALTFFRQQLQMGAARSTVALTILTSPEGYGVIVDGDYQALLHRSADPAGRAAFVSLLQQGVRDESVLDLFMWSDEYFSHV